MVLYPCTRIGLVGCRTGVPFHNCFSRGQIRRLSGFNSGSTKSNTGKFIGLVITSFGLGSGLTYLFLKDYKQKSNSALEIQSEKTKPSKSIKSTLSLDDLDPPQYGTVEDLYKALEEIKTIVNDSEMQISTDPTVCASHSDTFWNSLHPQLGKTHGAVVLPKSTAEVSAIVRICAKYRIPITPTSGLTSLEGHFLPTRAPISLVLDFTQMNKIIRVNDEDLDVVVQPGVSWEDLDDVLAPKGLMIGIDPAPGAMIGGCIANSCSGTKALKTGTMKENVVNLTVVLADGTIIKTKGRSSKSSAGYNLNGLFIGSEGTLGIVTEATLKLHVKSKIERVAVASFPNIINASRVCSEVVSHGLDLNAMEIVDDQMMACINASGETDRIWDELTTLFFKVGGDTEEMVQHKIHSLKQICEKNNIKTFQFATSEEEKEQLWNARKVALWSTMNYGQDNIDSSIQLWTTDVAVPISKLSTILSLSKQKIKDSGMYATLVGHAGDGNFHAFLLYKKEDLHKAKDLVDFMVKEALNLEGTCTGEHAIGYGKRDYLIEEKGTDVIDLMRNIKLSLDPQRILNPDKIFKIDPNDTFKE